MSGLGPLLAHDAIPRRSPSGGAWQRSSLSAAASRHALGLCLPMMLLILPSPLRAEPAHDPDKQDILVTGHRPGSTCDGKDSAQPIDYACLNGELKTAADAARPAPPAIEATASQANTPSKVGTFSHSATAQRMGSNFGKSAQPYRPPAPTYTSHVRGGAPR